MIRNQWYAVLESREIPSGKPIGVTRMGEKLVFWRTTDGELICLKNACPHRGAALSTGLIINDHLQCPFHGFEFDTSGQCVRIPALGEDAQPPKAMQASGYPIREKFGFVWLWWGEPRSSYPEIEFFESIDDGFSYVTVCDHWETHYSRAVENQLDVVHLPFIHRTTIGRGNKTVVDGPIKEWVCEMDDCGVLNIWVLNRKDDGKPARKERDLEIPDRKPSLQFRYPNLWHNWIGEKIRVTAAFAPIDSENTLLYLRYYQKITTFPIVKQLIGLMGRVGVRVITNQDRWIVETQVPKKSGLKIGETLIPGDSPIIEYRRMRDQLQKDAEIRKQQ
jgi:phenylpropionate dioxygenase-like ring-hydroxylating dioxygenase large terminal subunit